ncbi:MAG: efflux RND transporter periplasmic adaptor subunit [Burkholderiaceae bacterium]
MAALLRRSWPWWIVAGLGLLAFALWFAQRAREVEVVSVARGPIVQSILATGHIDTPARISVSSQAAARVEAVMVREGDAVRAGQLLVRLRSDEAEAALDAARAALREAEGRQRQIEQVQRPVLEQQRLQAQANRELARRELERVRALAGRGYVSQSRVDEARRQLDTAAAALVAAQVQADGVRPGGIEAELALARVVQARASLAGAEARLDTLALVAPDDATVLTRQVEPGDTAQVGRALLTLARSGTTRIIATIDERNLRWVALGQKASVLADAFPGQAFEARISWLAPSIDLQRGTVEIWLEVAEPPAFLRPDMTVSVELVVARRADVLRLPAWALRETQGETASVLLMRDGVAEARSLRLGIRGVGVVEIIDGLAEGDWVITPESGATAGERVKLPGPRARLNMGELPTR